MKKWGYLMKCINLLGVVSIFLGFGLTGCDALTGERYPIPPGNYEVPQTQQLQRGGYFVNDAPQQSTVVRMRQEVPFNWKD